MIGRPPIPRTEAERIKRLRHEGRKIAEIVTETGWSRATVCRVVANAGGLPPRSRRVRHGTLTVEEREEISRGLEAGHTFTAIAQRLGRHPSTVSREVTRNEGRRRYRAWAAEREAARRATRPREGKLAVNQRLRAVVEAMLEERYSPQQIANRLRLEYPEDPTMWVSHETIYQSLYVQGRGSLRKELSACLRTGRAKRVPAGRDRRVGQLRDIVPIRDRPPEVEDRAVPGHWEGDLIVGKNNASFIGTLVERSTRYVILLHLPNGASAGEVRKAMTREIRKLPIELRRTLTWDRGKEMAQHVQFAIDTGMEVYFCDPRSPWQRGSNENTNGLLRQYFPKGTDLSVHSAEHLRAVARQLNGRPRQTLSWYKPSEKLTELIALSA